MYWEDVKKKLVGVKLLAEDGATYKMIANYLGVSVFILKKLREQYPELQEALNSGRSRMIDNVEQKVYQKAMGIVETDVRNKVERLVVEEYIDDETGELKQRDVKKTVITRVSNSGFDSKEADFAAQKFLLEQYAPDKYQRKPSENNDLERVSVIDDIPDDLENLDIMFYDDSNEKGDE